MTDYTREQAAHDRVAYGLRLDNLTNTQHEAAAARRALSATLVRSPIDVTDTDDNGVRTYLLDDDGFPQIGQVDVDGVYDEYAEIERLNAKAKALEDGV
jgi:hypothetical protein